MIARKNKIKRMLAEKRNATGQTPTEEKPEEMRAEHIVELGKFFIDIAKLIFGGVILTALLDYQEHRMPILISAIVATVLLVSLGVKIIKNANIQKRK